MSGHQFFDSIDYSAETLLDWLGRDGNRGLPESRERDFFEGRTFALSLDPVLHLGRSQQPEQV